MRTDFWLFPVRRVGRVEVGAEPMDVFWLRLAWAVAADFAP